MVDGWVRFKNKIFEIAAYGCYFFVERMDTKLNLPTTVTLSERVEGSEVEWV